MIDGRVGYLGEALLKEAEQSAGFGRQHGVRRVVAHRADRLGGVLVHRLDDDSEFLAGPAELGLLYQQCLGVDGGLLQRQVGHFLQAHALPRRHLTVWLARGHFLQDVVVGDQPARLQIGADHSAGTELATGDDLIRVDVERADFAARIHDAIAGMDIACRAQAVAVERHAHTRAVGEGDAGRAVPRLHQRGVIAEKAFDRRRHIGIFLPRLRDHHLDAVRDIASGQREQFKHVVEHAAVAARLVDDGF